MDPGRVLTGDAIAVDNNRFLVIERDGGQGATAVIKRVHLADKRDRNPPPPGRFRPHLQLSDGRPRRSPRSCATQGRSATLAL